MSNLKVIKKDGSIIEFIIAKIINTCQAAGSSKKLVKKTGLKGTDELLKVKSSKIRELVIKNLECD